MPFPEDVGTITCRCVVERGAPVLFVSHAGNDWQMYCSDKNHDFEDEAAMQRDLVVVHIAHLVRQDSTLDELSSLPEDWGAERSAVGKAWTTFEDRDDA